MPLQKVVAIHDDDSNWYVIPAEMHVEFNRMLNESSMYFGHDEDGVEAHYKAEEAFIDKFNKYRTGGDLNNIQLYAEI